MAYTPYQKREHIRELQRYLYGLSFFGDNQPRVIPDGVYGKETALAVRSFQQHHGLRPTGETNRATWDAIVREYREQVEQETFSLNVFQEIVPGDRGLLVYVVQAILMLMAEKYGNLKGTEITGVYDNGTQQALAEFQRYSGQPINGQLTRATWNLLAKQAEEMRT